MITTDVWQKIFYRVALFKVEDGKKTFIGYPLSNFYDWHRVNPVSGLLEELKNGIWKLYDKPHVVEYGVSIDTIYGAGTIYHNDLYRDYENNDGKAVHRFMFPDSIPYTHNLDYHAIEIVGNTHQHFVLTNKE